MQTLRVQALRAVVAFVGATGGARACTCSTTDALQNYDNNLSSSRSYRDAGNSGNQQLDPELCVNGKNCELLELQEQWNRLECIPTAYDHVLWLLGVFGLRRSGVAGCLSPLSFLRPAATLGFIHKNLYI